MTEELTLLLAELALAPRALVPLPRLEAPANVTRAYRVELEDGTRLKASLVWSPGRAEIIERAIDRLRLPALPRVLGRRGRTLLFDWIEGAEVGDEALGAAGALLGCVHAVSPVGLVAEARHAPAQAAARVVERLPGLLAAGLIGAAEAGRLRAIPPPPEDRRAVFVHGDLCPENLVQGGGALRIIDNGSWGIGPAGYDLGRALWRWPMSGEGRARFLDAYRLARGATIPEPELRFWTAAAAVEGTSYRIGGPVAEAATRLRALV